MSVRQRVLQSAPLVAFALAIVFLGLSLGGYNPADPPGWAADPPNDPPANPCGPVGAFLRPYPLHQSRLVVVAAAARARGHQCPPDRADDAVPDRLGAGHRLRDHAVVSAGFVHRLAPGLKPSPTVGTGGYIGATVAIFLEAYFHLTGMILILAAIGLFGLALCHEVLFVWPFQELRGWISDRLRRRRSSLHHDRHSCRAARWSSIADSVERVAYPAVSPSHALPLLGAPDPAAAAADPSLRRLLAPAPAYPQPAAPGGSAYTPPAPYQPGAPFELPPIEILEPSSSFPLQEHETQVNARAMLLERTLLDFGYQVRVVQIDTGPVITQFEIELEAGLRVSKIMSLADDLAIALAVPSVRIVAPIPSKTTVGIEVPNDHRNMVRLGEVMAGISGRSKECKIPLFLGKDVKGQPLIFDLAEMPHLLMAGRTGTGKSVCLNAMILSILMTKRPDEVKMILIDPKKVELSQYKRIPHLMHPVVTDMKKAESLLAWACEKMDERYEFLRRAEVRNIQAWNRLGAQEIYTRLAPEDDEERKRIPTFMPYIVIIADELAEIMMTAEKEVEQHIVRLAQLARAVGIHLILATQKPVVDVVTGLIKGNLPAQDRVPGHQPQRLAESCSTRWVPSGSWATATCCS